jgi:hypothetical protein
MRARTFRAGGILKISKRILSILSNLSKKNRKLNAKRETTVLSVKASEFFLTRINLQGQTILFYKTTKKTTEGK